MVVTFHKEGLLAHTTLLCLESLRVHAESQGIAVELIAVLDSADNETDHMVRHHRVFRRSDSVISATFSDLALSRNHAIEHAKGRYVGIFDGDDYYSENWIVAALKTSYSRHGRVIVHPFFCVSFGCIYAIGEVLDVDKRNYSSENYFSAHSWISTSFGLKEIYVASPYQPIDFVNNGFGYEDWHWNLEVAAQGVRHVTAEKTALFYRRKVTSLLTRQLELQVVLRPSRFFDASTQLSVTQKENVYDGLLIKDNLFDDVEKHEKVPSLVTPEPRPSLETSLFSIAQEKREKPKKTPLWVVDALKTISKIDASLLPTKQLLGQIDTIYPLPIQPLPGRIYRQCLSFIDGFNAEIVFIAPWLKRGGADKGLLMHIEAAKKVGKKVLLILTEQATSPWIKKLPSDVKCLNFSELSKKLSASDKRQVLLRLIMQIPARSFHILNSCLGWKTLEMHGKSLMFLKKNIYVSLFCEDKDEEGISRGYAIDYLMPCYPYIKGILFDSSWYPSLLMERWGISSDKINTIYFPCKEYKKTSYRSETCRRVLWAGRITQQKRPDLLMQIAALLPDVEFVVYGYSSNASEDKIKNEMKSIPNITFKGVFDNIEDLIKDEKYALFLYTSAWDGLPQILLEVTSIGLPIIASTVGGIPELIHKQTGYPVYEVDHAYAYVVEIKKALEEVEQRKKKWLKAVKIMHQRHSMQSFVSALEKIPGYFLQGSPKKETSEMVMAYTN